MTIPCFKKIFNKVSVRWISKQFSLMQLQMVVVVMVTTFSTFHKKSFKSKRKILTQFGKTKKKVQSG